MSISQLELKNQVPVHVKTQSQVKEKKEISFEEAGADKVNTTNVGISFIKMCHKSLMNHQTKKPKSNYGGSNHEAK